VVLQVLSHAGQVDDEVDPGLVEDVLRPDPGELQQPR
jgi:hypothetical protein